MGKNFQKLIFVTLMILLQTGESSLASPQENDYETKQSPKYVQQQWKKSIGGNWI